MTQQRPNLSQTMRILCVAGARPNFMKIAPILDEIRRRPRLESKLVHTGQHYDVSMSTVFFDELGIPQPDINLEVGPAGREEQIQRISERFEPVVRDSRPQAVLVVGDVNSTVACARVARAQGVKVIHVEAGLRSFDTEMPEELNRIETDRLSDLLFVTEPSGMDNLKREQVSGQAFHVGNVMIDTLSRHLGTARQRALFESLGLNESGYLVGTFHRPSNVDTAEGLRSLLETIEYACLNYPMVIPLHPRTRASLIKHGLMQRLAGNPEVHLVDPLGYLDFISLVYYGRAVLTDSGGLQEETTYLQIPCITMRHNTERPITVQLGSNVLAGTHPSAVHAEIDRLQTKQAPAGSIPDLWDGRTAKRIVDIIEREFLQ